MIVLGFDTATPCDRRRAAPGGRTHARRRATTPRAGAHPGHATRLLAMARELLGGARTSAGAQLDRIAVGRRARHVHRPARRGRHRARARAVAVGRARRRLEPARARRRRARARAARSGRSAPAMVLAVIDARRGEVVRRRLRVAARMGRASSTPPRALAPEELAERARAGRGCAAACAGGGWRSATGRCASATQLERAGVAVPEDASPLHLRRAPRRSASWRARAPAASLAGRSLPDYRRRPDAELALGRRRGHRRRDMSERAVRRAAGRARLAAGRDPAARLSPTCRR